MDFNFNFCCCRPMFEVSQTMTIHTDWFVSIVPLSQSAIDRKSQPKVKTMRVVSKPSKDPDCRWKRDANSLSLTPTAFLLQKTSFIHIIKTRHHFHCSKWTQFIIIRIHFWHMDTCIRKKKTIEFYTIHSIYGWRLNWNTTKIKWNEMWINRNIVINKRCFSHSELR